MTSADISKDNVFEEPPAPLALIDARSRANQVLSDVLELVAAADGAAITLPDAQGHLTVVAAMGSAVGQVGYQLAKDRSLEALALRSNNMLYSEDTAIDPRVDPDIARRFGVASLVCLPLYNSCNTLGVLTVSSRNKAHFSPVDCDLLLIMANFVSRIVKTWVGGRTALGQPQGTKTSKGQLQDDHDAAPHKLVDLAVDAFEHTFTHEIAASRRVAHIIATKAISIACQPIMDLANASIFAVEALSRFGTQPERPPETLFSEASAVGLCAELETLCLELALRALPAIPAEVSLTVNVSPQLLTAGTMAKLLLASPERVVIELTEHTAVDDYSLLSKRIAELRARGTSLAVDDTGAGISSLAHILRLKPDFIKLDRSLVAGVDTDPARRALVVALTSFAQEIGARLIAEGIETEGELATVRALGVTLGQGFYLGPPAPVEAIFPTPELPGEHRRPGRPPPRLDGLRPAGVTPARLTPAWHASGTKAGATAPLALPPRKGNMPIALSVDGLAGPKDRPKKGSSGGYVAGK